MTGRVIALELSSSTASLPLSAKEGRKEGRRGKSLPIGSFFFLMKTKNLRGVVKVLRFEFLYRCDSCLYSVYHC